MENYFILNMETAKLELHFEKSVYAALTDEQKKEVKRHFLWGRASGCWISRAKEPGLYYARKTAAALGLTDAGKTGERLAFAEQMARKAERADRRADRYECRAEAAWQRGEALQAPINHVHGDIAFFTQPNINTSAGRAFTRRRDRMWQAYENGFKEFNKSEYWKGRAQVARCTAEQKELQSRGFVCRRIAERESDLRTLKKRADEAEKLLARAEAGETVKTWGGEILTPDEARARLEYWLDRIEVKLDELGFYQDCLDRLGGLAYGKGDFKRGDLLTIERHREPVRFVRGGPKNFTYEYTLPHMTYANGQPMQGVAAYAEITGRVEPETATPANHSDGAAAVPPAPETETETPAADMTLDAFAAAFAR